VPAGHGRFVGCLTADEAADVRALQELMDSLNTLSSYVRTHLVWIAPRLKLYILPSASLPAAALSFL
jgi:hypothetical protein